jgi:hypothetical protein
MILLRLAGIAAEAAAGMGDVHMDVEGILVPIVLFLTLFSFLSVAVWAGSRRREREAFYRSEERKKMIEQSGAGASALLELVREEEEIAQRRRGEGLKLGGLVVTAAGIGTIAMLAVVSSFEPESKGVAVVGVIPLLVGVAMLVYVYLLGPKPEN